MLEQQHLDIINKLPKSIYRFDTGVMHLNIIPRLDIIDAVTGGCESYSICYITRSGRTKIDVQLNLSTTQFDVIEILTYLLEESYQVIRGIERVPMDVEDI